MGSGVSVDVGSGVAVMTIGVDGTGVSDGRLVTVANGISVDVGKSAVATGEVEQPLIRIKADMKSTGEKKLCRIIDSLLFT